MTTQEQNQAKLAVLAAVAAVSTSALFVRASQAPPVAIAANRLLLTLIILAPLALYQSSSEIRHTSKRNRALAALAGVFLALHFILWFTSLHLTNVAVSVVLVSTHPLFILAFSRIFLRETICSRAFAGTMLALGGIVLIAAVDWQGNGHGMLGNLLALGGAVTVSGYFLLGRQLRSSMNNLNYVLHTYAAAFAVLAITAFFTGTSLIHYPAREWLIFLALAVFPTVLGHTVFNWALARVEVSFVSMMILGEPVIASALAFVIFGEIPAVLHVVGAALVLLGLGIFVRNSQHS